MAFRYVDKDTCSTTARLLKRDKTSREHESFARQVRFAMLNKPKRCLWKLKSEVGWLWRRGNGNDNDRFSLVADFTTIKLRPRSAIQNEWKVAHFDFQKSFPNFKLDWDVYAELLQHLFPMRRTTQ